MNLQLKVRGQYEGVEGAVDAVADRLPDDWPRPRFRGCVLIVPLHPDAIGLLIEELEARGLKFLADRVSDPVRWRSR